MENNVLTVISLKGIKEIKPFKLSISLCNKFGFISIQSFIN